MLTRIVQFLLYFSVALGIALLSGGRYLARDRRMAGFVGALVALLAAGHVLRSPRWTYPFERWEMYGDPEAPTGYNEFLIRDDAGPMPGRCGRPDRASGVHAAGAADGADLPVQRARPRGGRPARGPRRHPPRAHRSGGHAVRHL